MTPAIQTQSLTRYYGTQCVVDQLTLSIPSGTVFGLLGRNGAGKTTAIRMLLGLIEPTRGHAQMLGFDCRRLPEEARARIGYLAEGHYVYGWMSVAECGRFQRSSHKHWNEDLFQAVLKHFRLHSRMKAGNLSRGQRAGLCLALTLAPEPELLILDDPALGLDPVARRSLLESMLYVTKRSDRTILFSSHLLSDVERVADCIAVMDHGKLRAHCSVDEFRTRIRRYILTFNSSPPPLPELRGLLQSFRTGHEVALTLVDTDGIEEELRKLTPRIQEAPLGLEDAFIAYVGERGEKSFFLHESEVER